MSNKESWHLRKEVTIGNIFATISAVALLIGAFYNLDSRLIRAEEAVSDIQKHQDIEREEEREYRSDIRKKLDDIVKLLIEGIRESGR